MSKDLVLSVSLLLIVILKVLDLYGDIQTADLGHTLQELALVMLSGGLFLYLMYDMRLRTKTSAILSEKLKESESELRSMEVEIVEQKQALFHVIDLQFEQWGLSPAEQEVGLMLIKGYTTQEIASLRDKSEKTISNQASAIYRKAEVQGRHELAGVFLENLSVPDSTS